MRIGYSFWGFLGPGVVDTPDGGRSHRRGFIDGIASRGHEVIFLQANRDHLEARLDLTHRYRWDVGLPEIDTLFLEWRWPIAGRNTTACGTHRHTCDLHRQAELLDHYTRERRVPTIIWDKDRQLPASDPLRRERNVVVCEAALHPTPGATTLLFPVADAALDAADPARLAQARKDLDLAYVGNQYDRDDAFATFFAPAATDTSHVVAGKWTHTATWPRINFTGRIGFEDVDALYRRALTTVLLLPDRYARAGQMTQRLFEAVLAGCLPLTPTTLRSAARFTPPKLHVTSGAAASDKIKYLRYVAGTGDHESLVAACLHRLDVMRLSRQLDVLDELLSNCRREVRP